MLGLVQLSKAFSSASLRFPFLRVQDFVLDLLQFKRKPEFYIFQTKVAPLYNHMRDVYEMPRPKITGTPSCKIHQLEYTVHFIGQLE